MSNHDIGQHRRDRIDKPVVRPLMPAAALRFLAGVLTLAALGAVTPRAQAGTYSVLACDAASLTENINQSWGFDASPGHWPAQSCPSGGDNFRGITTRIVGQTVGAGVYERAGFYVPTAGMTIAGVWWNGRWTRNQCYWTTAIKAVPSGATLVGGDARPGGECITGQEASAVSFLRAPPGTSGLQQWTQCGAARCAAGATFHTYYASVLVTDPHLPAVAVSGGGLASGRWVRRDQSVGFSTSDNIGIASAAVTVGGRPGGSAGFYCSPYRVAPGGDASGSLGFRTDQLSDGVHTMRLSATDCANNVAFQDVRVKVDNTPPARVRPVVGGGEGWRARNGFSVRWRNPPDGYAPVVGAHYRLCQQGGACNERFVAAAAIDQLQRLAVSTAGDHTLEVWLQDEAGNLAPVSDPVHLRFDPIPPSLAFEPPDASDPLRVAVTASDNASGVVGGEIELRKRDGRTWHQLETTLENGQLVAYVDDERFRKGSFEFRARAVDRAGNERSTDRQATGSPATLTLPVRFATRLRAGVRHVTTRNKVVRRHGRRRVVRRRSVSYRSRARVRIGRQVRLRGVLTNPDGQPIDGATVDVFARARYGGAPFVPVGTASTDLKGRFSYRARAAFSRVLRFRYAGSPRIRAATREFTLVVPASSTLRVSRRRALNGQRVVFSGRLRGGHIAEVGKLTFLQAVVRDRWRTFATPRTDRRGRWRFRYRFGATSGSVRYRFRLCVPRDAGYPFDRGCSRRVTVAVRGL